MNNLSEAMNKGKDKKFEIVPLPKSYLIYQNLSPPVQKVFIVFSSANPKNKLLEYNISIIMKIQKWINEFGKRFYKNKPFPTVDNFGERKKEVIF